MVRPEVLQEAEVNLLSDATCRAYLTDGLADVQFEAGMFCAGVLRDDAPADTCSVSISISLPRGPHPCHWKWRPDTTNCTQHTKLYAKQGAHSSRQFQTVRRVTSASPYTSQCPHATLVFPFHAAGRLWRTGSSEPERKVVRAGCVQLGVRMRQ